MPVSTPTPTRVLNTPQAYTTSTPKPSLITQAFLDAWKVEDYALMYSFLDSASKTAINQEDFAKRYADVASEAGMVGLDYAITNEVNTFPTAEVGYQVDLESGIIGKIDREMKMQLSLQDGQWRINWNDGLILPELAGGNYLKMDSSLPTREAILDRNGNPLARQTDAVAVGVYPDYVNLGDDEGLISMLAQLSNRRFDTIFEWIEKAYPGSYLPIAEIAADAAPRQVERLSQWGAAVVSNYARRLYYGDGIAPHVVGYVSTIQEDEADFYRRKGYRIDERVGRKGIEQWGEDILMGQRGGTLYVFAPDGRPMGELGASPTVPGQEITLTLDRDYQAEAQKAMSVYNGAAVVLERDTGRVLAMVSSPGFNPNAYEIDNYNWLTLLEEINQNPATPQFNRAAQGQYPLGSVFKIITLAAALESGKFTPESTYDCQYEFRDLMGLTLYDWTWDHFQEDGETQPSGMLTLPQGLIKSCNPWFWHIGLELYRAGLTQDIAKMSSGFGLGSKTGIEGVQEEPGNVPEPASEVDATNLAIGQGESLVTPLQVARFIAAVGNGGTLYRPQLIEKIASPGGEPTFTFKPEAQGTLPVKPSTLALIQEAMRGVVKSDKPRGTAWKPMNGLDISLAGKTGTAQSSLEKPHAWFAGYTFENRPDKPDIAVVVIAENAGEGSEIAAPIVRRLIELYFYGKPMRVYPWEATYDVTRSPTPEYTETPEGPTPGPNINP